ncbi:MAG TPA: MFS transporter [Streptosporangiaceae bacterium]|nr:MFS transporter [Streptosporangiaceae bacterium]
MTRSCAEASEYPVLPLPAQVRLASRSGRWILLATVLGSSLVMIDMTVVNVALPTIGRHLGASLAGLQWTVTAYTLTLACLILLGGSLGDRTGRRRVFIAGVAWFALASALCGLAPDIGVLITARVLQGAGGALLTPGSLAIIQATFVPQDRARAVGAWTGLAGVASAAGPVLGGWLVQTAGWRWVFLLNLPLASVVVAVTLARVPESRDEAASGRFDVAGAVLAAVALAGIAYALIEGPAQAAGRPGPATSGAVHAGLLHAGLLHAGLLHAGLLHAGPLIAGLLGMLAAGAFWRIEQKRSRSGGATAPMLPPDVFASRQFRSINVITFLVYGAFSGLIFLLVLQLQVVAGFSPLRAGSALLPVTLIMLALSSPAGALAQRIGPKLPMAIGISGCAAGMLLMARIGPHARYLTDVLPAVVIYGLGASLTVAPLTATVLASADVRHAGVASGVNNAVARAAGLLAVAALPAAVGLGAASYHQPARFDHGFKMAAVGCAVVLAVAAALAALLVDTDVLQPGGSRGGLTARQARRPALERVSAAS